MLGKMICMPRLVNQAQENAEFPYRVELWNSNDGGDTFKMTEHPMQFKWYVEAEEYRKANRKNLEYDLMFGHLGNGTTVCNRMKEEYGDYQMVVHIDDTGMVHWYMDEHALPTYARKEVNNFALRKMEKFKQEFMAMGRTRAMWKIHNDFLYCSTNFDMKGKTVEEIYESYMLLMCTRGYHKPTEMKEEQYV